MTTKKCKKKDCKYKDLTLDQWIEKSYQDVQKVAKEYMKNPEAFHK